VTGRTVAVVTGHSRGLGAAIAAVLLEDPHTEVHGLARGTGPAHPRLTQHQVDLADPVAAAAQLDGLLARVRWEHTGQALLVNNAGLLGPVAPAGTFDPSMVAAAIDVDVTAAVLCTDVFLRATAACGAERRIAQVSSGAARTAYAGWAVYCAAKAALDQFTRVVALEAPPRCRISSVAPGVIDTDMQAEIRAADPAGFPAHERFVTMARTGALVPSLDAARRFVRHLRSDAFGDQPVVDLRDAGVA
jgi:NAD(P)-dependent dehydrogenase (short-subunit alcohol dehydrogenase family)